MLLEHVHLVFKTKLNVKEIFIPKTLVRKYIQYCYFPEELSSYPSRIRFWFFHLQYFILYNWHFISRLTAAHILLCFELCIFTFVFFPDIEECESNPCQNNGTCNERINFYTCNCPTGTTQPNCEGIGQIRIVLL